MRHNSNRAHPPAHENNRSGSRLDPFPPGSAMFRKAFHGEKLYETLLTREEMGRAESLSGYFRVPADARDLNYDAFFSEGVTKINAMEDYHSHNTERLDLNQMM